MILVGYRVIIKYLIPKKEPVRVPGFQPITIIVDAYETRDFINQKLDNLNSVYYPPQKRKIIFISDIEPAEAESFEKRNPGIRFILDKDKQRAYLEAFRVVDTDVIIFTDAETKLQKYSLRNVVECLNGKVAAVSGYFYLSDEPVKPYHRSKIKYHESIWELNYLEGCVDTSSILNPRLLAVRRSLFRDFDRLVGTALDRDSIPSRGKEGGFQKRDVAGHIPEELAFFLRRQGLRGITDHKACLFEESPKTAKSEVKKIAEKTARDIKVSYRNINLLFNPRYGIFGLLTFPFRRFFIIHFPFIIAFVGLYSLFHFPLLTVIISLVYLVYLYTTNNTYPVVFLMGVAGGWLELLFGKKGGILNPGEAG